MTGIRFLCDLRREHVKCLSGPDRGCISREIAKQIGLLLRSDTRDYVYGLQLPIFDNTLLPIIINNVSNRTRNALLRSFGQDTKSLSGCRIGDLMALPNFGVTSLLDLLTIVDNAELIGKQNARNTRSVQRLLKRLANAPATKLIYSHDPRFGCLVKQIYPRAKSLFDAVRARRDNLGAESSSSLVRALNKAIKMLQHVKRLTLEQELLSLLPRNVQNRNVGAAITYYGLDGSGGATLEKIASSLGVTRERVRQIVKKVMEQVPSSAYTPVLTKTLKIVHKNLPTSRRALCALLRQSKIAKRDIEPRSLINANEYFEKGFDINLLVDNPQIVLASTDKHLVRFVLAESRTVCARDGTCSVPALTMKVQSAFKECAISADRVAEILACEPDVLWLETGQWFYIPTTRNRLRNYLHKMLAVAPTLEVADLRAGLSRNHRIDSAPPKRILLQYCGQSADYTIKGSTISLSTRPNVDDALSDLERIVFDVFCERGGVSARDALERECIARGMNRNSFYQYLSQSPIIERLAMGVYCLRGSPVAPGIVEDLKRLSQKKGTVLLDYGWRGPAKIWLGFCLSQGMVNCGVFSVPSALSRFLQGEYQFRDESNGIGWQITNTESSGWSLSRFFSYVGAEAGDCMALEFDIAEKTGTAFLGTQELLIEFAETTLGSTVNGSTAMAGGVA